MKKQLFNSALSLSVLSALMLSSCQDYIPFDEEQVKAFADGKEYDQHFIERFGVPAEGHTWGMGVLEPIMSLNGNEKLTRAGSGQVNTNRNQWVEFKDNQKSKGYNENALAHDIQVPGWPNFDGYYYASGGEGALKNIYSYDDLPNNGSQPVGDVTEYEIQYVSAWFRQYGKGSAELNAAKVELHLTDFFIQNVSCDNDQREYRKLTGTQPIGNNGDNVHRASDGVDFGLTNINRVQGNEEINYSMDYLAFKSKDGDWTHINNFNRGNSNFDPENSTTNPMREIKYVTSSGTEDFQCRSSMATNDPTIEHENEGWVLVRLTWYETPYGGGDAIQREGYYLAFDFKMDKHDTKVTYDGYYSNWIVKITPGFFEPKGKAKRIMCEDLGGTFDFDFNDVVYDVAKDGNTNEYIITLQAAGGTLPLWVGDKKTKEYEVHTLLGNAEDDYTPVNVDSRKHAVAIYRIKANDRPELKNIPLFVSDKDGTIKELTGNSMTAEEYAEHGDTDNHPAPSVRPDKDATPRRFAVPTDVCWMKELKCIELSYPNFDTWVTTGVETVNTGTEEVPWYYGRRDKDQIYEYQAPIRTDINTGEVKPVNWVSLEWPTLIEFKETDGIFAHLEIKGWTGKESIMAALNEGHHVTLTYIYKISSLNEDVSPDFQAALVPVNCDADKNLSYKQVNYGTEDEPDYKDQVIQWTPAVEHPNLYDKATKTKYYTTKRTFTADDMKIEGEYCDHLVLMLRLKNADGNLTVPTGYTITRYQVFNHY